MNLQCDNYSDYSDGCKGLILDQGGNQRTHAFARAKGWHLFDGLTMGSEPIKVILCPSCIGTNRSRLPAPPPLLQGQLELEFDNEGEEGTPPVS